MWDVKQSERDNKEYLDKTSAQLNQQIQLGQRILALKGSPGFKEYLESAKKLREQALRGLIGCTQSNDAMRIIQGRVQALDDIVSLLDNTEVRMSGLRDQLERLEKDWQSISKGRKQ